MWSPVGVSIVPLLFNLAAESFSILVNQFQKLGWLEEISVPGIPEKILILQY